MSFSFTPEKTNTGGNGGGSTVDWAAFNEHVHETIQAAIAESDERDEGDPVIAVISGLIDLGIQASEEVSYAYDKERHSRYLSDERYKATLIENDDKSKTITYTPLPAQKVAVMIDFPEVLVDYGKFFSKEGESDVKPYRHILGGEFFMKSIGKSVVARPIKLGAVPPKKKDGIWTFAANGMIAKLAKATKTEKEVMTEEMDIGPLLGKQFKITLKSEIQEKNNNKYLRVDALDPTKKTKQDADVEYDVEPIGITFGGGGSEDAIKQLRASIKTTIQMAENFEGSKLQEQMVAAGVIEKGSSPTKGTEPEKEVADEPELDDLGDDTPF